jgi:hypothetical protein
MRELPGIVRFCRWQQATRQWQTIFVALGLVVVATGMSGCFGPIAGCMSTAANSKAQSLTLANAMHVKMAQGDLAGIYDGADQRYKDVVSREKSDALFSAVARKLGSPLDCNQQSFNFNMDASAGMTLRTICETKFSKDATGTETFIWIKSGDQFRLLSYNINSDALIER